MKYYKICYPDEHNNPIEETLSEQDILDFYWEYWYEACCWSCVKGNYFGMVLCKQCGNKRCPKATDHNFPCTNSNEPGQKGSIYEH